MPLFSGCRTKGRRWRSREDALAELFIAIPWYWQLPALWAWSGSLNICNTCPEHLLALSVEMKRAQYEACCDFVVNESTIDTPVLCHESKLEPHP